MSELDRIREFGAQFAAFVEGLSQARQKEEVRPTIVPGREVRLARLHTDVVVDGNRISFEAKGARSCRTLNQSFVASRTTEVVNLACDITYFAADDTPLGPIRVFQDPRVENTGAIFLRRGKGDRIVGPALSYFNQRLIFRVGERHLSYPGAWQVVGAIQEWPPEFHQYHHLAEDTPLYDFVTGEPNVARKGISTISIEGPISQEEEERIIRELKSEIELVERLPSKMGLEG